MNQPIEDNHILRYNMSDPDNCVIIDNTNSYRLRAPFTPRDFVIDWDGTILRQGDEKDLVDYRYKIQRERQQK